MLVDRSEPEQAAARLRRDRPRSRAAGIRRDYLAGQRDRHAGSALPRSRRLREHAFDELEEPVGLAASRHDLKRQASAASVARRSLDLQLVEFVRPSGRSGSSARGDHQPSVADAGDRAADPKTLRAGQVTLTINSTHGERHKARRAYLRIASFLGLLRQTAEQLDPVQRWYRILSEVLRRYLKGRQRPAAAPCASRVGRALAMVVNASTSS